MTLLRRMPSRSRRSRHGWPRRAQSCQEPLPFPASSQQPPGAFFLHRGQRWSRSSRVQARRSLGLSHEGWRAGAAAAIPTAPCHQHAGERACAGQGGQHGPMQQLPAARDGRGWPHGSGTAQAARRPVAAGQPAPPTGSAGTGEPGRDRRSLHPPRQCREEWGTTAHPTPCARCSRSPTEPRQASGVARFGTYLGRPPPVGAVGVLAVQPLLVHRAPLVCG